MAGPLCFVLMPFGKKKDAQGKAIDFDVVYRDVTEPAIKQAGLDPIRADQELVGGIIHKPMFERLILCDYAVADLTAWNANVMYELGVRHAVRPWRTVAMFAQGSGLPFDVQMLRALPYELNADGVPADAAKTRAALAANLEAVRRGATDPATDSPVFQLVEYMVRPQIDHTKTDVFREQVRYSEDAKKKLAQARKGGKQAVAEVERGLNPLGELETGVVIDLMLSYRATEDWDAMIRLVERMPRELAQSVMVREQHAFALNRAGRGEEAEQVLEALVAERGPRSETLGILGRVHKDRWQAAVKSGDKLAAKGLLDKAIATYLRGFEADWRDAYPGVNAVTLMEVRDPPDPRRERLLPIVTYAVERKVASGRPDYWDYATLLELAVLRKDRNAAEDAAAAALASVREKWEPKTTVNNLPANEIPIASAHEEALRKRAMA